MLDILCWLLGLITGDLFEDLRLDDAAIRADEVKTAPVLAALKKQTDEAGADAARHEAAAKVAETATTAPETDEEGEALAEKVGRQLE